MGTYRRLVAYVYPYRWLFVIATVCMFFFSVMNALASAVLYVAVKGFYSEGYVTVDNIPYAPSFIQSIQFPVAAVPLMVVGVFLVRGIFDYTSNYLMADVGIRAIRQVREELYQKMVNLSVDFYSKGRTGELMSRVTNDVGFIQGGITDVLVDLVKQPLVILINVPMVFIWGGKMAFWAVLVFPLVLIPIAIIGNRLRRLTRRMQERTADILSVMQEIFTGIRVVKAFNMEEVEIDRFNRINKSVFDFFRKTVRVTAFQRPIIEVFGAVGAGLAIWFGYQHLPPDRFVAFIGSLFIFYEPLKKLGKVNSTIQQSVAAGKRIFEVMDEVPTIQNKPNALKLELPIKQIDFEKVSFAYEGNQYVIRDLNLSLREGEVVAVVGPSGAGKTSLVNLLPRFYDVVKGAVKINGKDIRDLDIKSLREKIGIVNQETVLFNATVMENIAYGRPSASLDEVRQAAAAAYADGFIKQLPNGYGTMIGEKGANLSGGQRQRLSIARALLKNPPILILDEATSQLDTESEREVQKAIESLMRGRTVLVIAHRLSTVQNADRIVVIEDGVITQVGNNDALLKEGGTYKRLYDLQFNL
ncbi:MAG: ABC transporter permease [Candidatus Omnitrophica bacterium CG11_big_fil_rev_8_21_14_0_20_45_26]|uniref:ABC transporter permease n=1 Tax=Candidatus Abzuiibacterium crystallinum TaxID=1974748 RepID=A0A2H0LSQ0_9BACT|nr:MAG: ABC transporter permease [Candidatus Omnitrophica bacterium CG11_big_fil_rev_8_21_14_0_20_45_26]PIW64173.1 MAG: ABC transporter permease [Candidatus Omnitrophica bacterium CG12_big_fil_rev_8_21_14_0_65_45_16]